VYGEKVVGKIEALGSVGRSGSFFKGSGYCNIKAEPIGTSQGGISTKGGAPETATTLCLVRNANVPTQTMNGIESSHLFSSFAQRLNSALSEASPLQSSAGHRTLRRRNKWMTSGNMFSF